MSINGTVTSLYTLIKFVWKFSKSLNIKYNLSNLKVVDPILGPI